MTLNKLVFSILLFFSFLNICFSQTNHINIISGTIIDSESKHTLEGATIYLPRLSLGAYSDENGKFSINISEIHNYDEIVISHLGYSEVRLKLNLFKNGEIIKLSSKNNELEEVIISSKEFNPRNFVTEAVKKYNQHKRINPHIALAHYTETAKKGGNYIMYMESIGYSLYLGTNLNATSYSNYKFFPENSKIANQHKEWKKYKRYVKIENADNILPGGSSNLNLLRYFETKGILSERPFKKYKFTKDSSYYKNENLVYIIHFKNKIDEGNIHIYKHNREILKIKCVTSKYWSTAFNKRVKANALINFKYFHNSPFITKIITDFSHKKLNYTNNLEILIQKFNNFNLTNEDYWALNNYDTNPFIKYNPEQWTKLKIIPHSNYEIIQNNFHQNGHNLYEQFRNSSDKWYSKKSSKNEKAIILIKNLKNNF